MASPFNMPPWPGVTEPLSFPGPNPVEPQHENITDSDLILTRLREQIASGTQEVDVLLGAIAIAAQAMTDATGAALGMRRDGSVICVGRSGETAPAFGACLSENSGISGACLRLGRIQRCDDTEIDARVDAEVCRDLGLRSITAVPIRSRLETVGILEVFSTVPRAFTDEHLTRLSSLAELADAASATASTNSDIQPTETAPTRVELIPRPDLPILTSPWAQPERPRKPIWRYFAVAGAAVLLGLFSFASWRMWNEIESRDESKPVAAEPLAAAPTGIETALPTQASLPSKPAPEQLASTKTNAISTPKGGVVQAASIEPEPDDGLIRSIPVDSSATANLENPSIGAKRIEAGTPASTPPQVAMVTVPDDSLHGILASKTAIPRLDPPVSQGVVPLVLERKVIPAYPRDARLMRLAGAVVLRATVSDEGRVAQVDLISGDPVLARAAMDAIRQWRYRPALLNGKPTRIETDITINFKLP